MALGLERAKRVVSRHVSLALGKIPRSPSKEALALYIATGTWKNSSGTKKSEARCELSYVLFSICSGPGTWKNSDLPLPPIKAMEPRSLT